MKLDDYPETFSDSIYGEPPVEQEPLAYDEEPKSWFGILVVAVITAIWIGLAISIVGCASTQDRVGAYWDEVKERTVVGIGAVSSEGKWAGPIVLSWSKKIQPEVETIESDPPFVIIPRK